MIACIAPPTTFLDVPFVPLDATAGAIAVIGASHGTPYPDGGDVGYGLATGSAEAPDALRIAAVEGSGNIDHWDYDIGGPLLDGTSLRLVDCGNLPLVPGDGAGNRAMIAAATRAVVAAGGVPLLIGGDDSVPIPFLAALAERPELNVLQIDAHIDWRDDINGERWGYSSTMRRTSELASVRSITQVGMRGVGSARRQEVEAAAAWGARIIPAMEASALGTAGLLAGLPTTGDLVLSVDCDALDPAVLPAVNAPTPGGLSYREATTLIREAARTRRAVGFSLVEFVPGRDMFGAAAITAARLALAFVAGCARRGA